MSSPPRLFAVLLGFILTLAALLRLGALRGEFWFDEIWSWEFARAAASPWQILAGADQHHDNNHKLNTLFLWLYPTGVRWTWYRLHSLAAGLAAVALAALAAWRRGRAEAVFAALLFAVNYWLILCSTEARGYALAICFALLAFLALDGYLTDGRRRWLVLFWAAVLLGFSSHLTFLHCYLALGLWSVYHLARRRQPGGGWRVAGGGKAPACSSPATRHPPPATQLGDEIRPLLACHAIPGLFLVALYFVDVRYMQLGGAPPLPVALVLGRLFALGLGGAPAWSWPALLLAAGFFAAGLRLLASDPRHVGIFFAAVVVGSPALFLLGKPVYLFERYFLISFIFFLLLLSYVLGALWRHSRGGACAAAVAALAMVAGGLVQIAAFERGGRGHFLDALTFIDRQSPGDAVTVCGDYDFRVRKFHMFYARYVRGGARLVYREQEQLPAGGADWLLVHRLDDLHPPEPCLRDAAGNAYERAADFPTPAFGGWNWYVYRNASSAGGRADGRRGR